MIVENLTSYENKYLEMFYSELLNNLDFENLNFSKKISKQFLPTLAFVPEIGMVLVYEYSKDGSFKAQYKDGIKVFDADYDNSGNILMCLGINKDYLI